MGLKGLDFETYSNTDIKKHGLDRYISDPSFTVLIASVYYRSIDGTPNIERFDFVMNDFDTERRRLLNLLKTQHIAAHNASFERAVLAWLQKDLPLHWRIDRDQVEDTAVISRAMGAASKLEAAAPQLLDMLKLEIGASLIPVFCVPTKANGGRPYTKAEIEADPDLATKWENFHYYCGVDARLSYLIANEYSKYVLDVEDQFELVTQKMNDVGWYVDIPLVRRMQKVYKENMEKLESVFRDRHDPDKKLNLRSYVQLQRWCAERGVKAKSFDALHLQKLRLQLVNKLGDPNFTAKAAIDQATRDQQLNYRAVLDLIELKQELGGSSLTKLQTILDQVGPGGRLRGQYLHVGAGQTYRTSGRGVQMQNLPRLEDPPASENELAFTLNTWTNERLARNLRQVFCAENPDGMLIVGDFKSVESRGLAYISNESWKLVAYEHDKDIYKMLATTYQSFGGVKYDDVTKAQRQAGKVGELACGYGAGPQAVADFAEKMGILMSLDEATTIVKDWRYANPNIVATWNTLNEMLLQLMHGHERASTQLTRGDGMVELRHIETPASLLKQHPGAQSIELVVFQRQGSPYLRRIFHGCYMRGNDVCYYKPSELRSGELWRARMTQPPHAWYKLYGGKLAGILTQSFCRELFFDSLRNLNTSLTNVENTQIVGQFHDEIVVEWWPSMMPGSVPIEWVTEKMKLQMGSSVWSGFPLVGDIKFAHRYIK